jgi:hypothetical protein
MRKMAAAAILFAILGATLPTFAQTAKTLEALFTAAEFPFTKVQEGRYYAVVTVEQESERFQVMQDTLGNDPKEAKLQFIMLYFNLGALPKGSQLSAPLAKQITVWNTNLTMGKVVVYDNTLWYTTFLWLERTDAETLAKEAVIGHFNSVNLRKELAPYLKQ